MLQWIQDGECGVALDTRHDPALISTWHGQPTCALMDRYFAWSDAMAAAALAAEQQLIHIVDLRWTRLPPAAVRKRIMEHMRCNVASELQLATVAVVDNSALASLVRAAVWLNGRRAELLIFDSIDEAIERSLQRLRAARIPPPLGLEPGRYQPPLLERG